VFLEGLASLCFNGPDPSLYLRRLFELTLCALGFATKTAL
jgi:hypothetical protein